MTPEPCCKHDYDKDGNCHIHMSKGISRQDWVRFLSHITKMDIDSNTLTESQLKEIYE